MKTKILFFIALAFVCFNATNSFGQVSNNTNVNRNYADVVINSVNVINPQNAVDADTTNYAVMRTDIGILNYSLLKLGFSQLGSGGETAVVEFQNDGGLLSLDVLQSISITLYDNAGNQVARKSGFDFTEVTVGDAPSHYKIHLKTKDDISNIASVRVRINGLVTLENHIRLYYAYLIDPCPLIFGDILHAQHNVENAQNAVSVNRNDFALLTPPLLLGNSFIDIGFTQPGDAGKKVGFHLGEGNQLLNATLLQGVNLQVYDTDGNLVVSKSDLTLADVDVLPNGRFNITINTPKGNYQIGRGRITFSGLANVLTTLKVYSIVTHTTCTEKTEQAVAVENLTPLSVTEAKLYPNPFSGYTILNIKSDVKTVSTVIISDKEGHLIQQERVTGSGSIRLLEKASPGIYFMKIISGNNIQTQTIMKLN